MAWPFKEPMYDWTTDESPWMYTSPKKTPTEIAEENRKRVEELVQRIRDLEESEAPEPGPSRPSRYQLQKLRKQIKFLMEMFTKTVGDTERGLVESLRKNPKDQAARNAYVDWLLEHERTDAAELVRNGFTP